MTWWRERMLGFDLETTAPDPEEARVVTAALALVGGGQPTETATWLIDPGVEIPAEAEAVHGISTEMAQAEGLLPADALAEILDTLAEVLVWGAALVIFNARFDLTTMDREARRYGLVPLQNRLRLRLIDPFLLDKWLDRYRKSYPEGVTPEQAAERGIPSSRTLTGMCLHYGAKLDGAHDAAFDAIAAARAAWCIGERGAVIRKAWDEKTYEERRLTTMDWDRVRLDLDLLQPFQRRIAHEQAAGLAVHFHETRRFENALSVQLDWPVILPRG